MWSESESARGRAGCACGEHGRVPQGVYIGEFDVNPLSVQNRYLNSLHKSLHISLFCIWTCPSDVQPLRHLAAAHPILTRTTRAYMHTDMQTCSRTMSPPPHTHPCPPTYTQTPLLTFQYNIPIFDHVFAVGHVL